MTPHAFRKIALSMQDAAEGAHMDHPDFRAHGKIFATLAPDKKRGMVKLTPDQQMQFILARPDMFEPASGAWGRQGCTMVRLEAADEETLGGAITLAWQGIVAKKAATRRPTKKR